MKQYKSLMESALDNLWGAVQGLVQQTEPATPMPRPRRFHIVGPIFWPHHDEYRNLVYEDKQGPRPLYLGPFWMNETVREILAECPTPRHVLRAIRRLQAAAEWCEARIAGRYRAAQEILRQQSKYVNVLEDEAIMASLQ